MEVHRKFLQKWPHRITELEAFLFKAMQSIEVVHTPEEETVSESEIRDLKDRPILRSALNEHAEYLLTGDHDFLESSIEDPRIISVVDFLDLQPPSLLDQLSQSDSLSSNIDQVRLEISIQNLENDE